MVDWRCGKCGRIWEEMVRVEDGISPQCCGNPAFKVWVSSAPLHIVGTHFNRSLGKTITSARQFERELKNAGCHLASKQEIEESLHGGEYKPTVDPEPIKAAAEKAWSELHVGGQIP